MVKFVIMTSLRCHVILLILLRKAQKHNLIITDYPKQDDKLYFPWYSVWINILWNISIFCSHLYLFLSLISLLTGSIDMAFACQGSIQSRKKLASISWIELRNFWRKARNLYLCWTISIRMWRHMTCVWSSKQKCPCCGIEYSFWSHQFPLSTHNHCQIMTYRM